MKRILALILVTMLILSGCNSNESSSGTGNVESSSGERTIKDTIIFAQGADITSLDPHVGKQLRAVVVSTNIFDTLVEFNEEREIVAGLAESWKYLSDTSIEFKIKEDVKFHNGEDLTADDIKFSLERAMASSHVSNYVDFISGIEVVDEYTVIVNTNTTYAPSLSVFTTNLVAIVPKDYIEEVGDEEFAMKPIGTGRYKFLKWKEGEYCELEAFEDCHWGVPPTKYLTMKVVPENAQRTIMLETGEIDIAYEVLVNDVSKIEDNPDLTPLSIASSKTIYLSYDMTQSGPLSNKFVRQAIEHAIDKEQLVDVVLAGKGKSAQIIVPESDFGYTKDLLVREYNIEKAKDLLLQAGYGDGFEMNLWTDTDSIKSEYAQIIQNQLLELGITVKIKTMEYSALSSSVKKEPYESALLFFNPLTGDGGHTLYTLFTSGSSTNNTNYNNPVVDELLKRGLEVLDEEERLKIYNEIYSIIREDMPMMPLYNEQINVGINKNVENFVLRPTGMHKYIDTICYK